jgi:hypothetical protein
VLTTTAAKTSTISNFADALRAATEITETGPDGFAGTKITALLRYLVKVPAPLLYRNEDEAHAVIDALGSRSERVLSYLTAHVQEHEQSLFWDSLARDITKAQAANA